MLTILIVYAVEEERVFIEKPDCIFHYCRTGVGKVQAAIHVENAIQRVKPDLVLNIGTAGSVKFPIGSVHTCCKFIDRDMEKLQNFGVPFQDNFEEEIEKSALLQGWTFDSICNTGDTFLTSADGTGDVFDMESFAVASVCKNYSIPFAGIKCVTDIIGQNSVKHWEEKLAEAQDILQNYMKTVTINVPDNYISRKALNLIERYQLERHPEGGWYKEVFRSSFLLSDDSILGIYGGERSALTSIYYLLTNQNFSAFHKIKSPEIWYFHEGMTLTIHIIHEDGEHERVQLSNKEGCFHQYTVPENCWFAAEIKEGYGYSFVSCAVAPGFDFADFKLAKYQELLDLYPQGQDVIKSLCR